MRQIISLENACKCRKLSKKEASEEKSGKMGRRLKIKHKTRVLEMGEDDV